MFSMTEFAATPQPGAMLLVAAEPPSRNPKHRRYERQPPKIESWKITRTRHELLVAWSEVKVSSRQQTKAGFEQIIAFCQATGRGEFIVEDIAPDYKVGDGDPAIVMETQERIVRIFTQATRARFGECPVYRLSLRNGAFDIRFYLGRTRPSDYWAPEMDCQTNWRGS